MKYIYIFYNKYKLCNYDSIYIYIISKLYSILVEYYNNYKSL